MPILQRILSSSNISSKRTILSSSIWLSKKDPPDVDTSSLSSSSSSDSDSDEEKTKNNKPLQQKETPKQKLSALLQRMVEEEKNMPLQEKLNLAKPRQIERAKAMEKKNEKKLDEKLASAAKEVAEDLGGDVKKTEMELLEKLLYKKPVGDDSEKPSKPKREKKEDDRQDLGNLTLSELLTEMKIDRSKPKPAAQYQTRADQVRSILGQQAVKQWPQQRPRRPLPTDQLKSVERINLFNGEPFGFFKDLKAEGESKQVKLDVWEKCYNRELRLTVTQPPTNIYEEIIQWTDKGMLWHFPIDNEQGLEEEKQIYFSEHVHLEHHLEGWCPEKGPIRNFMELVCVGLSKNYWLTVEEKKAHINWFRDFFVSKRELIKDIGAGDVQPEA